MRGRPGVWYGGTLLERLPRLRGRGQERINYRHVIGWLVRKPGAFERYRYREDLFPTSRFRMAYDVLVEQGHGLELDATELSLLLSGIDLSSALRRKRVRPPAA